MFKKLISDIVESFRISFAIMIYFLIPLIIWPVIVAFY